MANPNPFQAHAAIRAKGQRNAEQYRWIVSPLCEQGLNFSQIARTCEAYRLKTPGGNADAKWDHSMVRKIVQRLGLVRHDEQAAA